MRISGAVILVALGACAPTEKGDCSPKNCIGCCDSTGVCQPGASTTSCGAGGFNCRVCSAGLRCVAQGRCETDPNAITGSGGGAAGGGPSGGGGPTLEAWQQEYVDAHNTARRVATPAPSPALPQVGWNAEAAAFARLGADRCIFEHRSQNQYGENLHASSAESTPTDIVEAWDSEKAQYTYATNRCSGVCGHYTQVVWRGSVGIGCATARCTINSPFGNGAWWLTACNYAPPGNYVGQKPY